MSFFTRYRFDFFVPFFIDVMVLHWTYDNGATERRFPTRFTYGTFAQ